MKLFIKFIVLVFCAVSFSYNVLALNSSPDEHAENYSNYIPTSYKSTFLMLANTLEVRSDALELYDKLFEFCKSEVKIEYGNKVKLLDDVEKKALAIALLRLQIKDTVTMCDFNQLQEEAQIADDSHRNLSHRNPNIDTLLPLSITVNNSKYSLYECFCAIKIISMSKSKNTLFDYFLDFNYRSCELYNLLLEYIGKGECSIKRGVGLSLFLVMSIYSKDELAAIFDFLRDFTSKEVFLEYRPLRFNIEQEGRIENSNLYTLAEFEKKKLGISLVRSLFFTDSTVVLREDSDGNLFQVGITRTFGFLVLYDNKSKVFSLESNPHTLDFGRIPYCVRIGKYRLENSGDIELIKDGNFPAIFYGPKELSRTFSYFSPELYEVIYSLRRKFDSFVGPVKK